MASFGKFARKTLKVIGWTPTIKPSNLDDAELLEQIRKNIALEADATDIQRSLELDDLRYLDPTTQWSDEDRRAREGAGRPCLTEDLLGPFHRQICNEQRKNKPAVQVNPVDSGSDQDTAEIAQGLIRHIEYSSNADTAYDTAFWWAAGMGRGFYRLCTDYIDAESDEQEILIKRIPNPHMVFLDPSAQEADFSDARWGGIKAWVTRDDFKAAYPDSELAGADSSVWHSIGDDAEDWMSADACMVAEYFWKDSVKVTTPSGRESYKTKIRWVKCTAVEILERGEIPGEYIPIIPVLGEERIVNGKRTWAGIVRSGKDPQKRHNYLLTSQTERIAFMPIATWLGPVGFMGHAEKKRAWEQAHKRPVCSLEYEIIGDDGQGINAPRLITEEAPIRAVTEAMVGAQEGLKAVLGMYDPNIGRNEGNQSGIAIRRLQVQGETGNYHLQDNLARAMRLEGRIILSWLPTYYDTERVVRIIGEDGTQKQVRVNGPVQNPDEALNREHIGKVFDLRTGKYDVTISAGPSYQSKREEDRALMMAALTGPMGQLIANRAGDLWAKTLDSPIAKELVKRLMPPDIAQQDQQKSQIDPQQVQQLMQQHEALTQQLNAAMEQIEQEKAKADADIQKAQLDAQTKLEIARMNNETELIKVNAQITLAGALPELKAQLARLEAEHGDLQELALAHHAQLMPPTPMPEEVSAPMGAPSSTPQEPAGQMAGSMSPAQPENAGPMAGMEASNE